MSSSENSSLSSDSSSDDSNTIALNQWEERVSQQNHQIYTIVENMLSNIPNLTAGVQASRVRKRYCERQREIGAERLINDYFGPNPTYGPEVFRRRFRMHKSVFLRIVEAVTANVSIFRRDAMLLGDNVCPLYRSVQELCGCWRMGHHPMSSMNICG